MKNKLEKFLITINGALFVMLGVFGIKIQDEKNRINNLREALKNNLIGEDIVSTQRKIGLDREKLLREIANSPTTKTTETSITTTVLPGKTIKRTETVTPSKTTRSS